MPIKLNDVSTGILLGCLLIILYTFICRLTSEGYSSKREKAEEIADWWASNRTSPSYTRYKKDIEQSDIVEYSKAKNLPSHTPDHIESIIS